MVSSAQIPSQQVPTVANKYIPLFELGRGGMGNVILAVIQGPGGFNKLQVVKRLRPDLAQNPEFLSMFLDEARLSARINHANVVQTNEVGFDGRHYFIAMEFLEGQSLEAVFTRALERGAYSYPMFVRMIIDALNGLHHAHDLQDFDGRALNVVHRDISPQNIFITYDGQAKILDFGIAKAADSSSETRTGIIKGKVAYMSPEQFRSSSSIDRRTDVFAMGAIIWRVIAGVRLWKGLTDLEVYQYLAKGEIPPPTEKNPDAPPELVSICMKALAVDPAQRYQTAAELQQALEDFLDHFPERSNQRQIGKLVTELFEDRRAEVKAVIEQRLAGGIQLEAVAQTGELPVLEVPQMDSLEMGAGTNSMGPAATAVDSVGRAGGRGQTQQLAAPASAAVAEAALPQRGSMLPLAIGGGALLIVGALGAYRFFGKDASAIGGDTTTTATSAATSTVGGATTDSITVKVTTAPPEALVYVDSKLLPDGKGSFPKDGAKHVIRVEAPGYLPKSSLVDFSASVALGINLDKVEAETRPAAGAAARGSQGTKHTTTAPVAAPDPAQPTATQPVTKPTSSQVIDRDDPWAKSK